MTERTTLYALIVASQSQGGLSDEAIDAAFRVRSREKAFRLAQQTFYGSLELALFSDFDIKGNETILELQHRMANQLIPHDVPDKNDMTPLLDIFGENSRGRQVAWYRYLWCDVQSASLFERFKHIYTNDSSAMPQLRQSLRQLVLKPTNQIKQELDLTKCSPDALLQRYALH